MSTTEQALPLTVRRLLGASVQLLVRADEAAARAGQATERLRSAAALLPRPRRPYDEL